MKITVAAVGSRGDTQPYIALAQGLQRAGHEVTFCAGDNFAEFVEAYALKFMPVGVDIQYVINVRLQEVMESGRNIISAIGKIKAEGLMYADAMFEGIRAASEGADAIIANVLAPAGHTLAEKYDIPLFWAHTMPIIAYTHQSPHMVWPVQRNMGGVLNGLSHRAFESLMWGLLRSIINKDRKKLDMPPLGWFKPHFNAVQGQPTHTFYEYSPALLPPPTDWSEYRHVTGYWFLDAPQTWQPPDVLVDFLQSGPPPIYIGFGSMSNRKPEEMTEIVLNALKKSGQRGLLFTGWGGVSASDMPDDVLLMESAPHDWIFPRMAGVVHHGGAGTTAAGLRAGVPTQVVPFFGDQYFWGNAAYKQGAGLKPIARRKLNADNLADSLRQMATDKSLQKRAAEVGELIRCEQGVQNAVDIINRVLENA